MHVESISFNWHLFRNTNLTYHDEMWKKMYLASEIIFEFILAYFILLFGHFWPKHLFDFKKNYFYVYINDTASKSLKQARKIVLLSHLKGLTKLDFAWLWDSNMFYSTYSVQFLCTKFQNTDNITTLLNRLINEGN